MKILLIAGHGGGDPGAIGNAYKECTLTRHLLECIINRLPYSQYNLDVTKYDITKNCYEESKRGNIPNYSDFDFVLELHFNAFSDSSARGSEVLYRTDDRVKDFGEALLTKMGNLGFANRGVKLRSDLLNMNNCYNKGVPYALFETCFITNAGDVSRYQATYNDIADAIIDAIAFAWDCEESEKIYRVQTGAFKNRQNAVNYAKELKEKGIDCFIVES